MIKKIFSIIGVSYLLCFSFYYTNLASIIIKNNDPIMKEIRRTSSNYELNYVNAIINDNNIIPGVVGIKVDINKSYYEMKKYGSFNDSLLVFQDVLPEISISNTYDKYISKGNEKNKNVSLIFKVENTNYIEEILNVLYSKDIYATFFVNKNIIDDSIDILDKIVKKGCKVELLDDLYKEDNYNKYNRLIKKYTNQELKYCYLDSENFEVLNNCCYKKMHTIIPNIMTNNYPYNLVKNKLEPGSIIKLSNNGQTLKELKYIINYIEQRGYTIVLLDDLIKE
ncbi:MAG: polysaccharide deacetylase family protein [bacterium]|nr:polysaccharide deacetylase family protein [bacterium]